MRRQLGLVLNSQVGELTKVIDTWKRVEGPLGSLTPADPSLIKPSMPGGCVIC